jgi:UDP-N-acetylmuramoyl-tripeptide--D-alanyl-D-alanine ligase
MASWDLGALARAAGSDLVGGTLPERIAAVGTDSRSLPPASLFVALRGDRFDGHDFVVQAQEQGAAAVMVDRAGADKASGLRVPRLVVADTMVALGEMARFARQSLGKKVVGVTGSNGKTTTKEMVAAVLSTRGPVHKTTGNLNNHIGLPLTVLAWPEDTWAGVLEMGMSGLGEIAHLADLVAPDVAVITMVGPAHLQQLGTLENVARAKGELFEHLPAAGVGVVNVDDPLVVAVSSPLLGARRRLTFGRAAGADVRLVEATSIDAGVRARFEVQGRAVEALLPIPGPHNAMNAAGALAVGLALGVSPLDAVAGLANLTVPGGRMRIVRRPGGVSTIDDSYNANPASMIAAFAALASVAEGRRIAVLGDMLELGSTSPDLHRQVGRAAAEAGIDLVLGLGTLAAYIVEGAREGGAEARGFSDMAPLLADLDRVLTEGDFVLVKGSRGMKMERAVAHLAGRG